MAVTNQADEYKRLRSYLTPYIKGPVTDAVLNSLATSSAYLVNNAQYVNDSLYIVTAQQQYLDLRLADYGITRDPTIGLSDDIFRTIGIQVKNRKVVRDLINNILDAVFSDTFVKATSSAATFEPYALQNGDTLLINFDGTGTQTITFYTSQFTNIAAATAQEVANAISIGLSQLGVSGSAIVNNDGNGNYVELLSNTIGASSSVTVLGGRSQNVFLFPSTVPAGGNFSTQWTISLQNGGNLRFTWSGGANPNLGDVQPLQYVNIFGGGFASSSNEGTYLIVSAQGGAIDVSYFEITNPLGSTGIVVQGTDSAIMFFVPTRETILNKSYYAAVYQTENNILQIFMPATTQTISRSRIGSAHLHGISETPVVQIVCEAGSTYPASGAGAYYIISDLGPTYQYYVWFNVDGGNTDPAPAGFTGIEVNISSSNIADTIANETSTAVMTALPAVTSTVFQNVVDLTVEVVSTIPDAGPSTPNTLGPYIFDTQQGFTIGGASTTLTADVNGETGPILNVVSSAGFPDGTGWLVINYGCEDQEVIPYIAAPSSGTILISPAYFIQQNHPAGESVLLIAQKAPITLATDGSDYAPFLTDTASGRVYAQKLIDTIVAAGVTVIYTILYPNPIGLGGWENPLANEISIVYGP
jgi:hypothetical protein